MDSMEYHKMELRQKSLEAANWCYGIAGMTIINSIITLFDGSFGFMNGLGFAMLIDAVIKEIFVETGTWTIIIDALLIIPIAGIWIYLAYKAKQLKGWAFITALVLYGLDTIIVLLLQMWIVAMVHVFIIFTLYGGWKSLKEYLELEAKYPTIFDDKEELITNNISTNPVEVQNPVETEKSSTTNYTIKDTDGSVYR
jgi:hypothetical protein